MSKNLTLQEKTHPANTLTALAVEAMQLAQMIVEAGGEISPEVEARLDVNQEMIRKKTDNYVAAMDQFELQSEYWKKKADACRTIAKAFEAMNDQMRDRIKFVLNEMQMNEIRGDEYRFKLSKLKPKLVIEKSEAVPKEFSMQVITRVPDKEKITQMLNDGFSIEGCRMEDVYRLSHYEIKPA